ncbi:hypothetical protein [Antribacter gilvus]|uniref:hypothetical protein n=1 Tax=Antribacter gilvus TaxID=2304675 RepID=UPI000F768CEC|nr:hypothetical protein [Antribacter gilvus]
MSDERPVGVRIDVDHEGHLTVLAADVEWVPPGPGGVSPQVPLGRSDVPWVLDSLLAEHRRPLDVVLRDRGKTFRDLVLPQSADPGNPSFPPVPPGYAPDRHRRPVAVPNEDTVGGSEPVERPAPKPRPGRGTGWFEAGGYTPGEKVSIAVIVTRVRADDQGRICLILPAALRPMIGDSVAIGEESREINVSQAGTRAPATGRWIPSLDGRAPTQPTPGLDDLNLGFRRPAGGPDLGM